MSRPVFLALVLILASAAPALAAPPPALHALRAALSTYDLEGGGTVALLADIHARLPGTTGLEAEELRFLRAAVAADLSFIAAVRQDDALRAAVAAAIGTTPEALPAFLAAELNGARGTYAQPARAIADALHQLYSGNQDPGAFPGDTHGEVLRLLAMRQALSGDSDPITALEPFGVDPCSQTPTPQCSGVHRNLEARARRAVQALLRGAQAISRLHRAARDGDPLSRALSPELDRALALLRSVELRPVPRIDDQAGIALATGAEPLSPDLVLIVGPEEVHYGFAPRLRLAEDGTIVAHAAGEPMLPALAPLSLPTSFRPYMTPLREVSELIAAARKDSPALSIAVGARGDAKAHLLGRVLLSIRETGNQHAWLLARSEDGFARGADVRLVSHSDAPELAEAPLRLRVRLGGYSLHVGDAFEDIPRVRDEQGLRFDLETLQSRLSDRKVDRADVSFMSEVDSQNLTAALFRVAGRSDETRLVFP